MPSQQLGPDKKRIKGTVNKEINFRYLGNESFPSTEQVTSVAVVPLLHSDQMVAVELRDRGLDIPGGHIREGETSLQAAVTREAMEEAYINIYDLKLVEVIESDYYGNSVRDLTYMIIFTARVKDLLEFVPNEESTTRRIVAPEDFLNNYHAGDIDAMRFIVSKALKIMIKNN